MARRKSFNRKERERLYDLYGGTCYLCGNVIDRVRERFEIEHVIPWALTQDDSDDNLRLAHVKCHRTKTGKDVSDIARAERLRAKHLGLHPKSRNPLKSRGFEPSRSVSR